MRLLTVLACFALLTAMASAGEDSATFQEITAKQEEAVDRGAAWLGKTQRQDGSWYAEGGGGYPCAMTGLAGLALLAHGNTPGRGRYGDHVLKAIRFLLKRQQNDGFITAPGEDRPMYGHGFAMTFLAECYGMLPVGEESSQLKSCLQKAVSLVGRSQSHQGGWYYSPNSGMDEGSVTITQVQALRACRNVGIDVPEKVLLRAIDYVRKSQQPDGGIAYGVGHSGSTPALSAAGAELFMMAGLYGAKETNRAIEYVKRTVTADSTRMQHDSYTSFYASQALHQIGGADWQKYFEGRRKRYIQEQGTDGSWRYTGWGASPVFDTSVAIVVLTLPYQYLSIYQK